MSGTNFFQRRNQENFNLGSGDGEVGGGDSKEERGAQLILGFEGNYEQKTEILREDLTSWG